MTFRHNYSFVCVTTITILALLNSCTPTRNQNFRMSFLPPAPKSTVAVLPPIPEAPKVEASLYINESPSFLNSIAQIPPRLTNADLRIRRADERFQAGKKLYKDGDIEAARKEFDRAIDILMSAPEGMAERAQVEKRLEDMVAAIHRYDVNGMGAGDDDRPSYDKAPLEDILEMTFPVDPSLKPRVKEQLAGTTSQLPLQMNDLVLSYIHFFQSERGRRTLLAGLKRAGKYRPLIQKILAEEGVPQELIFLAQAESGFLPRAVSHKAAVGMWQFVQFRGREYGLMQTANSDDRLDPEKATRSAARHLRDLYEKFGDWYLAIAAYNCGPGGVEKAVQRTGYADYWELRKRNALPRETSNYVPIILAMTIMVKNAKDYDLEGFETDPPLEYENLKVTSPTHLTLIADVADRPVSDIRELNPALLSNVAPANYEVHIPKGTGDMVMAGLQSVPENRRASWRVHRLAPGDTLESIARQYNMPVKTVTEANAPTVGNVGDIVVIPASLQEAKSRPTVTRYGKPIKGKASSRTATAKRNSGKSGNSSGTPAASFKSTSKRASLH